MSWPRATTISSSKATSIPPPDNVRKELSRSNDATTICGRKGQAHHYGVVVDGEANPGAARYYPTPKQAAEHIKDHFAFWRGISVER